MYVCGYIWLYLRWFDLIWSEMIWSIHFNPLGNHESCFVATWRHLTRNAKYMIGINARRAMKPSQCTGEISEDTTHQHSSRICSRTDRSDSHLSARHQLRVWTSDSPRTRFIVELNHSGQNQTPTGSLTPKKNRIFKHCHSHIFLWLHHASSDLLHHGFTMASPWLHHGFIWAVFKIPLIPLYWFVSSHSSIGLLNNPKIIIPNI